MLLGPDRPLGTVPAASPDHSHQRTKGRWRPGRGLGFSLGARPPFVGEGTRTRTVGSETNGLRQYLGAGRAFPRPHPELSATAAAHASFPDSRLLRERTEVAPAP